MTDADREKLAAGGWADAGSPDIDARTQALCNELGNATDKFIDQWLFDHGVANNSIVWPLARLNLLLGMLTIELVAGCGSRSKMLAALAHVTRSLTAGVVAHWDSTHGTGETRQ